MRTGVAAEHDRNEHQTRQVMESDEKERKAGYKTEEKTVKYGW